VEQLLDELAKARAKSERLQQQNSAGLVDNIKSLQTQLEEAQQQRDMEAKRRAYAESKVQNLSVQVDELNKELEALRKRARRAANKERWPAVERGAENDRQKRPGHSSGVVVACFGLCSPRPRFRRGGQS
jgi:chromosome segregation ATPase